jgi:hypothetical protein
MNTRLGLACCTLLFAGVVAAAEPLDDQQLDDITAGADDTRLEEVVVNVSRLTASGKRITAEGSVAVDHSASPVNSADLLLRDSAQSNLSALVNLNAVNSLVNVLVNLNININSHVGELHQINMAAGARP